MLDPNPNDGGAERGDCANTSEADGVTATVTSGAQPASDTRTVAEFMSAVVVWPDTPTDPGYVNLHYSMTNTREPKKGLLKGMGWPFRSVDKLVERAAWINTVSHFKDVWFCTSLQSAAGKNAKGNPKAVRLAANAIAQKAIWIDVDVGGDAKHYGTVEEALKAVLLFATTVGLPTPSAIVYSGGGIHVYWISKAVLTPAEWLPYASGLKQLLLANAIKCDTGLTTDIARLLRVPGTFNHKYDPPKPVTLAPLPLVMYDFKKLDFLKDYAAPMAQPAAQVRHSIYAEGVSSASFSKPHPLFASLVGEPDLNAGIDKQGDNLLDPFPIFRQCGFLREALTTGGKDYDQTLWMYSILCSTFMENGNDIAHRYHKGISRIPRMTHRRSMIARWLSDMIAELGIRAAPLSQVLVAKCARRARSAGKLSRRST